MRQPLQCSACVCCSKAAVEQLLHNGQLQHGFYNWAAPSATAGQTVQRHQCAWCSRWYMPYYCTPCSWLIAQVVDRYALRCTLLTPHSLWCWLHAAACVAACSLPVGQRYAPPLEHQQLSALARLSAKKSTDRKAWLEALTAPMAAAAATLPETPTGSVAVPLPGAASEPAAAACPSSSPLPGSGVEVSSLLGIVRGRVLPAPHLAYQQPECCYPGSQVRWWCSTAQHT